jgi:hypothetical protein
MTMNVVRLAAGAVVLVSMVAACGSPSKPPSGAAPSAPAPSSAGKETNPAGDIPDTQAYVAYTPPGAVFSVKVPEGWSRAQAGAATLFSDKLNRIRIESHPAATAPTVASVTTQELPQLQATPGFTGGKVVTVTRKAGPGVLITYQATSAPDPVTGKTYMDAIERYEFWHGGSEVVVTLAGSAGSDNVDPWRIISDSLRWH